MKKTVFVWVCLLMAVQTWADDGRSFYNKYSEEKDVNAVYISPMMFRLLGAIPSVELKDEQLNLTPVIRSLTGFYLINSTNAEVNCRLAADMEKLVGKGRFELLMEARDDGETVKFYALSADDDIQSLVMSVSEASETTLIFMDGHLNRKDLETLLAGSME